MGFSQKVEQIATCPDFTAVLNQQSLSGTWKVAITYRDGSKEHLTFANERSMRNHLQARSRHEVQFKKVVTDGRASGVEDAKTAMLASAPRKSDHVAKPVQPEASKLEQIGFSGEEASAITEGCFLTASQLRPWFNPCQENREIVFRYLADQNLQPTAVNIGTAIEHLYSRNHLIRTQRRRGDSPIIPYLSPTPADTISEEQVAKKMDFKELQQLVHAQQREAKRRREKPEDRAIGVNFRAL